MDRKIDQWNRIGIEQNIYENRFNPFSTKTPRIFNREKVFP